MKQFSDQNTRFVFEVLKKSSNLEAETVSSEVTEAVKKTTDSLKALDEAVAQPKSGFEQLLENTEGKSVVQIIDSLPESEKEPFRKELIQQMFGGDKIRFTIDDNPFSGPGKNGIEVFFKGLVGWLDSIGCSHVEKQAYIPEIVTLYVCGYTMLRQTAIESQVMGDEMYANMASSAIDVSEADYDKTILKLFKIKNPSEITTAKVSSHMPNWIGDRPGRVKENLFDKGVPESVFEFHTALGDHHSPLNAVHIQYATFESFELRIRSYEAMMRSAGFSDKYRVTSLRTPGGAGTKMNGAGDTLFDSQYGDKERKDGKKRRVTLEENIKKWNDKYEDQQISCSHWTLQTDTGVKRTPEEIQQKYLDAMEKENPFVALMHFARLDMDQFNSDFYNALVGGFLNQKYETKIQIPSGYVSGLEADVSSKYEVVSGDSWSKIAAKYPDIDIDVLAQINKDRTTSDIVKLDEKLVLPYGVKRRVLVDGDNLLHIASDNGLTIQELRKYNGIADGKRPDLGQSILIPRIHEIGYTTEVVEDQYVPELLVDIARKYNMTESEVRKSNNLSGKSQIGQRIFVSPKYSPSKPFIVSSNVREQEMDMTGKYRVVKGDSLSKISSESGVFIADIKKWNKLEGDRINAGQVLFLVPPSVSAPDQGLESEPFNAPDELTHLVWFEDSIGDIADRYGVTELKLCRYNRLKIPGKFQVGKPVKIPNYKIGLKDDLDAVARKFGTTVSKIKEVNNMRQDAKFQVEQELKIPSHILQSGESVEVLASDWDTNVSTLYLHNNLSLGSKLMVGQRLKIPPHEVGASEKIEEVASRYGVTVENLLKKNDNKFEAGQLLELPPKSFEQLKANAQKRESALKRVEEKDVDALHKKLFDTGIKVWSSKKLYEETGKLSPGESVKGRTILTDVAEYTMEGLLFLQHVKGLTPHLSGVAEHDNGHIQGLMSHGSGRKVDIRTRLDTGDGRQIRDFIKTYGVHVANYEGDPVYHFTLRGEDEHGDMKTYDYEAILEKDHIDLAVLKPGDREYRLAHHANEKQLVL